MSRLRLVSIITHTNQGGAQGTILSLSRELRRRGHDIEVWFLYGKTTHFRDEPGVRILLQHTSPNFLGYLRILFRLVKRLISVRLDGVITFLPLACVMGQTGARLAGIRCRVASQRNPYWTYGLVMRFCDKIAGRSAPSK